MSSGRSLLPNIMVAVVRIPRACASAITAAHCGQPILFGEISRRTASTRTSAPPPGSESRPAACSRRRRLGHGQPGSLGDVDDLGRGEGMDLHLREARLDLRETASSNQSMFSSGCSPPCISSWVPPWSTSSCTLARIIAVVEQVGVRRPGFAVEGAEAALRGADVGVVDVAVDDEGHPAVGVPAPADGIGQLADGEQVDPGQQPEGLGTVKGRSAVDFAGDALQHRYIRCGPGQAFSSWYSVSRSTGTLPALRIRAQSCSLLSACGESAPAS